MLTNIITYCCFAVALSWVAVLEILTYPISKKLCARLADYTVRVCAPRVFAVLSVYKNFRIRGYKDNKEYLPDQFLIMANHQSLLDIPLFMVFLKDKELRFVAKDSLSRHIPVVSEMLRVHGHAMVPRRGSPSKAMKVLDSFADRVRADGQIPVIFPEGTRSRDGSLGTFYAAGFRRILDRFPLPVAVCALDGGYRISTLDGILRHMQDGSYNVKVLKVYPAPHTKAEQLHILEEGKELIQKQLDEWRSEEKTGR